MRSCDWQFALELDMKAGTLVPEEICDPLNKQDADVATGAVGVVGLTTIRQLMLGKVPERIPFVQVLLSDWQEAPLPTVAARYVWIDVPSATSCPATWQLRATALLLTQVPLTSAT